MGNLTAVGLALDLVGAIILLGPEYSPIERVLKRIDPLYRSVSFGMRTFYDEAWEVQDDGSLRTTGKMSASRWEFIVSRWFLNRRIKEEIDRKDTMNLSGVAIERNGQPLYHTDVENYIGEEILGTRDVERWLEESQQRRMYRLGGGMLVLGFGMQLLAQFL